MLLKNVLITFEPSVIQKQCTAIALSSFITHCNSYIRKLDDWSLIFDFLLCVGIGCHPSDLPARPSPASQPEQEEEQPASAESEPPVVQVHPDPTAVKIQIEDIPESDQSPVLSNGIVQGTISQTAEPMPAPPTSFPLPITAPGAAAAVHTESTPGHGIVAGADAVPSKQSSQTPSSQQQSHNQQQPSSPHRMSAVPVSQRPQSPVEVQDVIQPFIPGNSSVRDVEAYKKCVDILTVIIKEILPKNSVIQSSPKIDAEINQMAIDSLITLRFYSLQDERLREQTGVRKE